jgi:hypothetical protein
LIYSTLRGELTMRALAVAAIYVFAIGAAAAQPSRSVQASRSMPPDSFAALHRSDRTLTEICGACRNCLATDSHLRQQLVEQWRRRSAILEGMSPRIRVLAVRRSGLSQACAALARQAAQPAIAAPSTDVKPIRPNSGRSTRKGTRRNGPSSSQGNFNSDRPARPDVPPPSPSAVDVITAAPEIRPIFPWPPPTPSTRRSLPVAKLAAGPPPPTWGGAADRIEGVLRQAHIESWGYYLAGKGFAVVTRVEQIDGDSGIPLAGTARWPSEPRVASSGGFLGGLLTFSRPVGHYRTFVFVVTADPVGSKAVEDEAKFFETARRWAPTGAPALPDELRRKPIMSAHQVIVLVYEFEHAVGGRTRVNVPSRWTFDAHTGSAGIVFQP